MEPILIRNQVPVQIIENICHLDPRLQEKYCKNPYFWEKMGLKYLTKHKERLPKDIQTIRYYIYNLNNNNYSIDNKIYLISQFGFEIVMEDLSDQDVAYLINKAKENLSPPDYLRFITEAYNDIDRSNKKYIARVLLVSREYLKAIQQGTQQ